MIRLLYAASEHDADILYPTGFFAPDPFLCLIAGSRTILVMSNKAMALDRLKRYEDATRLRDEIKALEARRQNQTP